MIHKSLITVTALFSMFALTGVSVAGDAAAGKAKSAVCAGCHGVDGNSANPSWPKLAGQGSAYIEKQLADFKSKKRTDPMMDYQASVLSDTDMSNLAAYFSGQTGSQGAANEKLATAGAKLYRGGNKKKGVAACIACHGPTGFRGVADAVRLGKSMEEALWEVAKRIDVPDYKFLVIAISIQRETGGNLAETLAGLANTLRKRRQIKLKIKAMSSEARASAWIIGSLPFIMFFMLWLANDAYVLTLIEDPRGVYMIGAGLTLIGTGVGIMAKMVRFEI